MAIFHDSRQCGAAANRQSLGPLPDWFYSALCYLLTLGVFHSTKGKFMAGFFELSNSSDGQFRFVLKAGNGEIILPASCTRPAPRRRTASPPCRPIARRTSAMKKDGDQWQGAFQSQGRQPSGHRQQPALRQRAASRDAGIGVGQEERAFQGGQGSDQGLIWRVRVEALRGLFFVVL